LNPISLTVTDTPGDLIRTEVASDFYFGKADVILIVIDASMNLDDEKIDRWTQFVLNQVQQHHEFTMNQSVMPPMIVHVFTKLDRVLKAVHKRNEALCQ